MALIKACNIDAFQDSDRKAIDVRVDVNTKNVVIFKVDNEFFSIDRYCTHTKGDLLNAGLEGKVVVCPVHEATFNLETGQLAPNEYLSPHLARVIKPTKVYPVIVKGEEIFIEID
ncbi:MAG: Rieske (2Fe-2S) protein [Candidatus Hodarchaeota archaeon]